MDIIHLLPDSVANQIAAGEVVQRPASVIKELMENAVDAGASNIDVVVVDAGRELIQVIDDGKGMSETDARLAFERHATSKIRQAEDIFSLHTMGFRGEALPSIAAVAQVHLQTRTADRELGTELVIEGSQVVSQEACSCPVGANFQVRNLFFNTPARRKFLKTNQTELNNLIQDFERIALVNPSVAFTLTSNGSLVSNLPAGSLRQRVVNVFGKRLNEQLLSVETDSTLVRITGFVGKPSASRKKGAQQYLFVNGRYMRHPYFHRAVMEAFAHLIPEGEQVPYFLYFDVDPHTIDVNIHPTKTEIKFENEVAIWQIIVVAVREALGRFNAVPAMDFESDPQLEIPVYNPSSANPSIQAPKVQVDQSYNPFGKQATRTAQRQSVDWMQLYNGLERATSASVVVPDEETKQEELFQSATDDCTDRSSEHFQFKGQYILTPVRSGLMIVDQHRAHVRILYDRYMHQMEQAPASTQGLLFPEMVQLSPSDASFLEESEPSLRALGFDLSPLGGGSYSINGVPADLGGANPVGLLGDIVENLKQQPQHATADIRHRLALTMARQTSIVVGQVLSQQEMDALINDLFLSSNPNLTPSGKTILTIMKEEEIDGRFV